MSNTRFISIIAGVCFTFASLSGCSLVSPKSKDANAPEIHDVPFQARDSRDTGLRKRIMVLPFLDAGGGRSDKVTTAARDAFVKSLRKTDAFVIIQNSDFPKDVASYLKNSDYDLEAMAKVANDLGLAAIIQGKIVDIQAKRLGDEVGLVREVRAKISASIQVRVLNTKGGNIIMDETRSAEVEDSTTRYAERSDSDRYLEEDPHLLEAVVTQAFKSSVGRIVQSIEKLSWEGRVALVKGDRVYLNAGRVSGIMIGDILKVTEDGEDVYDPESGALIGKVQGRLKGTIEIVSYFGRDGAVGIVHSGSGFRENDHVELY